MSVDSFIDTNVLVYAAAGRDTEEAKRKRALVWIEQFEIFPNVAIDLNLVKLAIEISELYQISYWDGAIVAAAEALGADTLYSEDLNHEQVYGSVRVCNPF